jgi:hypothetical protein
MYQIFESLLVERLGQDWFDHMAMYIGESEMATLVLEGQSFVIDPQKVEDCSVKIMNMNSAFRDTVRVFVRLTVGRTGLNPTPGKPG